jgi:hypothetical protein
MAGQMPCVAGLLVQKELNAFSQVRVSIWSVMASDGV